MSTNTILFKMSPQSGIATYFMFERLLEQHWAVYAVLHDQQVSDAKYRSLNLTEEQWAIQADGDSFKATTGSYQALCEAEIVCVSLVYPIINSLISKHLAINDDDLSMVKAFKEIISEDLTCPNCSS